MSNQNPQHLRPVLVLTGLLIAFLALACSSHAQGVVGQNSAQTASPAEPYNYVFLDPLEGHSAAVTNEGNHIQMHGHWVIDVKNPDGTVAEHRDFENTLQTNGAAVLVALMAGYAVPADWEVFLTTSGTSPCVSSTSGSAYQGCVIVKSLTTNPGSTSCAYCLCAATLTQTFAEYSKTFVQLSPSAGYTDNALQGPAGIAFDSNGDAWVAGQGGPELSGFSSAGAPLPTTPIYAANGASLAQPTGIAIDGANTIWVTNSTSSGYLSEFTATTGAPVTNEQVLGSLNLPVQVAIDPSGNLWTANSGDSSVTIFVGLAAPTTTPPGRPHPVALHPQSRPDPFCATRLRVDESPTRAPIAPFSSLLPGPSTLALLPVAGFMKHSSQLPWKTSCSSFSSSDLSSSSSARAN